MFPAICKLPLPVILPATLILPSLAISNFTTSAPALFLNIISFD